MVSGVFIADQTERTIEEMQQGLESNGQKCYKMKAP